MKRRQFLKAVGATLLLPVLPAPRLKETYGSDTDQVVYRIAEDGTIKEFHFTETDHTWYCDDPTCTGARIQWMCKGCLHYNSWVTKNANH